MQRPTRTSSTASYPTLIVFVPVAIETGGTWHHQAVELVQEIGRRTANITGDVRVQLPVPAAVRGTAEGECGLISKHVHHQLTRCNPLFHIFSVLVHRLCAGGPNNNNNNNNKAFIYQAVNRILLPGTKYTES